MAVSHLKASSQSGKQMMQPMTTQMVSCQQVNLMTEKQTKQGMRQKISFPATESYHWRFAGDPSYGMYVDYCKYLLTLPKSVCFLDYHWLCSDLLKSACFSDYHWVYLDLLIPACFSNNPCMCLDLLKSACFSNYPWVYLELQKCVCFLDYPLRCLELRLIETACQHRLVVTGRP